MPAPPTIEWLIDSTYFIGEISIPGLTIAESTGVAKAIGDGQIAELEWFIHKYEKKLLTDLLTAATYTNFLLELNDVDCNPQWTILKNMLVDEDNLTSCIANYIYYWWKRNEATMSTGVGGAIPQTENALRVSPEFKMMSAWNDFSQTILEIVDYIKANPEDFNKVGYDYSDFVASVQPINVMNV
jgi:hypothetical protein